MFVHVTFHFSHFHRYSGIRSYAVGDLRQLPYVRDSHSLHGNPNLNHPYRPALQEVLRFPLISYRSSLVFFGVALCASCVVELLLLLWGSLLSGACPVVMLMVFALFRAFSKFVCVT